MNPIRRANEAIKELNRKIEMIEVGDCVRFHFTENGYFTKVGMVNEIIWGNDPSDPSGGQTKHFVVWTLATKHEDNQRYEVPFEWITEVVDIVDTDPLP